MPRAIPKREAPLAFFIAFLACLVWTWPMALEVGRAIPFDPRFSAESAPSSTPWVWEFWWVGRALEQGLNPFECPWVSWPVGESLAWREGSLPWAVLFAPVERILGPVVAFQGATWLRLSLAGGLAYLLARRLEVGRVPAAVGSLAWTLGPASMASLVGHWPWMAAPELPGAMLVALLWKRAEARGFRTREGEERDGRPVRAPRRRRSIRGGILRGSLLGGILGFSALQSIPGAVLVLVGVGVVLAFVPDDGAPDGERDGLRDRSAASPRLARTAGTLAAVLVAGLLAGPRLRAMERAEASGPAVVPVGGLAPEMDTVDALDFFRPPGRHPLFRDHYGSAVPRGHGERVLDISRGLVAEDGSWQGPRPYNAGLYLGLALSTLAVLGLGLDPLGRRLALVSIALALAMVEPFGLGLRGGPGSFSGVLIPYTARAQGLLVLLLALVAARALSLLSARREGRWGGRLLVGVLLFEVFGAPVPQAPVPGDPILGRLGQVAQRSDGEEGASGAVLALHRDPGNGATDLLLQMEHGQPITHSFVPFPDQGNAGRWARLGPEVLRAMMGQWGAPRDLERELEILGVSHLIAEREWLESMPLGSDTFDSMPRWERAESSVDGDGDRWAWWYPSSLLYR